MKEVKLAKTQKDFEEEMTIERAIEVYNEYYIPRMKESPLSALFLPQRFAYNKSCKGTLLEIELVNGTVLRVVKEKFLWWMANEEYVQYYRKEMKKQRRKEK